MDEMITSYNLAIREATLRLNKAADCIIELTDDLVLERVKSNRLARELERLQLEKTTPGVLYVPTDNFPHTERVRVGIDIRPSPEGDGSDVRLSVQISDGGGFETELMPYEIELTMVSGTESWKPVTATEYNGEWRK